VFIWYILCSFGTFFQFWYNGLIKNLATLLSTVYNFLMVSGPGRGFQVAAGDAAHQVQAEAAQAGPHQGLLAYGGGVHSQPGDDPTIARYKACAVKTYYN
jgi:hypothetical protein